MEAGGIEAVAGVPIQRLDVGERQHVEADGLDVVVGAFVLVLLRPGLRIIDV